MGCQRLGLAERPKDLVTKQAVAAVGQGRLMKMYDDFFAALDQPVAQVLLTRENLGSETHYFNALNTFNRLLEMNIVPIVNENDTVSGIYTGPCSIIVAPALFILFYCIQIYSKL